MKSKKNLSLVTIFPVVLAPVFASIACGNKNTDALDVKSVVNEMKKVLKDSLESNEYAVNLDSLQNITFNSLFLSSNISMPTTVKGTTITFAKSNSQSGSISGKTYTITVTVKKGNSQETFDFTLKSADYNNSVSSAIDITGVEKISVGVPVDFQAYAKSQISNFKNLTGIEVEIVPLSSDSNINNYLPSTTTGGLLPDGVDTPMISLLGDNLTSSQARSSTTPFDAIDLGILGQAKYSLRAKRTSAITPDQEGFEIEYDTKKLDFRDYKDSTQGIWQLGSIPGTHKVIGIPVGYQGKTNYIMLDRINSDKNIVVTIPQISGEPLKHDTGVKATYENIYKFLADAGDSSTELPSGFAVLPSGMEEKWHNHGPLAEMQRLGSLSSVLSEGVDGIFAKDFRLEWEYIASLEGIYDSSKYQITESKMLEMFEDGKIKDSYAKTLWESIFGYYSINGGYLDKKMYIENGGGEGEIFAQDGLRKAAIIQNHEWMHGTINTFYGGWDNNQLLDNLRAIPVGYSEAITSSWAMKKDLTPQQKDAAMLMLRYLLNDNSTGVNSASVWQDVPSISMTRAKRFRSFMSKNANDTYNEFYQGLTPEVSPASSTTSYKSIYTASQASGFKKARFVNGIYGVSAMPVDTYNGLPGAFRRLSDGQKFATLKSEMETVSDAFWLTDPETFTFDKLKELLAEGFDKADGIWSS